VVLPHHFAPSKRTAPLPANLRAKSLSAIRDLYSFAIVVLFNWYPAANIQLIFVIRLFGALFFGYLADFCSVIWRIIFQLFG
jgi:hypothetical protein